MTVLVAQIMSSITTFFHGSSLLAGSSTGLAISIFGHFVTKGPANTLVGATGASASIGAMIGATMNPTVLGSLTGSIASATACAVATSLWALLP